MIAGTQSHVDAPEHAHESDDRPEISVCESCPGRAVFIESGNTDGWIASDDTVEVTR